MFLIQLLAIDRKEFAKKQTIDRFVASSLTVSANLPIKFNRFFGG